MVRTFDDVQKRTRNTIVRNIERLENKYGENVVRIVVNRFYTIRTNEKRALAQKEKLERELEKLKKRL